MKRFLLVGISALTLVACGSDGSTTATPPSPPPTASVDAVTQAPVTQGPVTRDPAPEAEASEAEVPKAEVPEPESPEAVVPAAGEADCLSLGSKMVTDAVASVPWYFDDLGWNATQIGNECSLFTWVRASSGGMGGSPVHILFFGGQNHEYLRTATLEPYSLTNVRDATEDTVTVEYRWIVNGYTSDPDGGPVEIQYQWDGSHVNMIGTLPPEITG